MRGDKAAYCVSVPLLFVQNIKVSMVAVFIYAVDCAWPFGSAYLYAGSDSFVSTS